MAARPIAHFPLQLPVVEDSSPRWCSLPPAEVDAVLQRTEQKLGFSLESLTTLTAEHLTALETHGVAVGPFTIAADEKQPIDARLRTKLYIAMITADRPDFSCGLSEAPTPSMGLLAMCVGIIVFAFVALVAGHVLDYGAPSPSLNHQDGESDPRKARPHDRRMGDLADMSFASVADPRLDPMAARAAAHIQGHTRAVLEEIATGKFETESTNEEQPLADELDDLEEHDDTHDCGCGHSH